MNTNENFMKLKHFTSIFLTIMTFFSMSLKIINIVTSAVEVMASNIEVTEGVNVENIKTSIDNKTVEIVPEVITSDIEVTEKDDNITEIDEVVDMKTNAAEVVESNPEVTKQGTENADIDNKISIANVYYQIEGKSMPKEHQDYMRKMCIEYGIEDKFTLVMAICYQESKFDPSAIGGGVDYGYMQINKCNHNWLRKELGVNDFLNPYDSIKCGVYMISELLQKYSNDSIHCALMAYNMGEGGARKCWRSGIYSSKYSRSVMNYQGKVKEM